MTKYCDRLWWLTSHQMNRPPKEFKRIGGRPRQMGRYRSRMSMSRYRCVPDVRASDNFPPSLLFTKHPTEPLGPSTEHQPRHSSNSFTCSPSLSFSSANITAFQTPPSLASGVPPDGAAAYRKAWELLRCGGGRSAGRPRGDWRAVSGGQCRWSRPCGGATVQCARRECDTVSGAVLQLRWPPRAWIAVGG